jgi:hypothetical protein
MTTPKVQPLHTHGPHGGVEVYHAPSDMFATLIGVDSKSFATINHPLHGTIRVPCSDLKEG